MANGNASTAPTIDYDALASKHGGSTVAPVTASSQAPAVDYDALASKYGGNSSQEPDESYSSQALHWLSNTEYKTLSGLADYYKGTGMGALQGINSISRLLNAIPGIGKYLAPTEGIDAARQLATPTTGLQRLGSMVEQGTELALAPETKLSIPAKALLGAVIGGGSTALHQGGTTPGINPTDVAVNTTLGGVIPALFGGGEAALNSKPARGMINTSVMATPRDVMYGNPAKALLDEGIWQPGTGDLEKYKDAIRSGGTLSDAAEAAGGRVAAINSKLNEVKPQLDSLLSSNQRTWIPSKIVTDPIDNAIVAIRNNRSITDPDVTEAVNELNDIRKAALKVPGAQGPLYQMVNGRPMQVVASDWTSLGANELKHELGASVNWTGRERVGELVDPIKREIYGQLKEAINNANPGSAELNERLTNLMAAQEDVNKMAGFEETGRGRVLGSVIGPSWIGRIEALAGRAIPALSYLSPTLSKFSSTMAIPEVTDEQYGKVPWWAAEAAKDQREPQ